MYFLFPLSPLEGVQTLFTSKIFDVFVNDWLKLLINIHCPRRKLSRSCSCEDVSQVVKRFGALEATWKTSERRTIKEKVAP